MKKLAIVLMALLPLGLLSACSDNDDPKPENPNEETKVYSVSDEDFISKVSGIVWIISEEEGNVRGFYGDGTEVDQDAWPVGGQGVHDLKFENGQLIVYWRPWGDLVPELRGVRNDYEFDETTGIIYVKGNKKYRIEGLKDGRLWMTDYVGFFSKTTTDELAADSYIIYSLRPATEKEAELYNSK